MIGLGTLINAGAIVAGGVAGALCGHLVKENHRESVTLACGVATLFIGIAGAMDGMKQTNGALLLVLTLVLGVFLGELIGIEKGFTRFGEWLKRKTGNASDTSFVNGFVTASLTVCIGAMAVVGSVEDGIHGDPSILITKAILDFVIVLVLTCSLGKGCAFSAIPVFLLEGGMTLLASFLKPLLTEAAVANLSFVGSVLIFCVGLNLVFDRKIRVANFLPALILTVAAAFLPF